MYNINKQKENENPIIKFITNRKFKIFLIWLVGVIIHIITMKFILSSLLMNHYIKKLLLKTEIVDNITNSIGSGSGETLPTSDFDIEDKEAILDSIFLPNPDKLLDVKLNLLPTLFFMALGLMIASYFSGSTVLERIYAKVFKHKKQNKMATALIHDDEESSANDKGSPKHEDSKRKMSEAGKTMVHTLMLNKFDFHLCKELPFILRVITMGIRLYAVIKGLIELSPLGLILVELCQPIVSQLIQDSKSIFKGKIKDVANPEERSKQSLSTTSMVVLFLLVLGVIEMMTWGSFRGNFSILLLLTSYQLIHHAPGTMSKFDTPYYELQSIQMLVLSLGGCYMLELLFYWNSLANVSIIPPLLFGICSSLIPGIFDRSFIKQNTIVRSMKRPVPEIATLYITIMTCVLVRHEWYYVFAMIPLFIAQRLKRHRLEPPPLFNAWKPPSQRMVPTLLKTVWKHRETRGLFIFLLVNIAFMFVEMLYGIWSHSLSLICDAAHMFFDSTSLAIGLYGALMKRWNPNSRFTYGYDRYSILSGFVNGLLLVFISVYLFFEAIHRLLHPVEVVADNLMAVSILGFIVNMVGVVFFQQEDPTHDDQNIYGIYLHMIADMLGSVAVILSTLMIQLTNYTIFDPLTSIFISSIILVAAVPLLSSSSSILLQKQPKVCTDLLSKIMSIRGVRRYHHPHFWCLASSNQYVGSIHLGIDSDADAQAIIREATAIFGTIQAQVTIQCEKHENDSLTAAGPELYDAASRNSSLIHDHHQTYNQTSTEPSIVVVN